MLEVKDFYKINDKVYVYQNMFDDPQFLESFNHIITRDDLWRSWYTFGSQIDFPLKVSTPVLGLDVLPYEKFKQDLNFNEETDLKAKYFYDYVEDVFYATTKHFFESTKELQPEGLTKATTSPALMKYTPNPDFGTLVMGHHTDYQQEKADEPGYKFLITCNMYLNDNYDGGEVSFKVFKDESNDPQGDFDHYVYTPKAGDVVIFPSRQPYYHGVKPVSNGIKYFIRSFYTYNFPGTQEWHANKEKFGEEVWKDMELQRQKTEMKSGKNTRDGAGEYNHGGY